jgi:hypothetical protein
MAGLVPAIYVLVVSKEDVDARDKPGHDGEHMTIMSPHQIRKFRMLLQIIHHEATAGDHL